ncbi:MAG: 16S rRNA (cytidine(1402)-2'-O)-methyltransferase [Chitinophagaceae bacterium]|nr:16S rRNA (cytidine(1402)-2'-O)-methyltransferase [Chitinophagaceae bacterium]
MKLYVVPTPIGNLQDITFRAIETLKKADVILAEDTRTSRVLLNHYQIDVPLWSYHQHNEHKVVEKLIEEMQSGKTFALISDAGTPAISDPGFLLVRACIKNKIAVECLPGATAFVPALVNSGFPINRFVFEGFLPPKKGRQTMLNKLKTEDRAIVFYESPHRIIKTLAELQNYFEPERLICVCRELSKKFEEVVRGTLAEVQMHFEKNAPRGEFVVVISGCDS